VGLSELVLAREALLLTRDGPVLAREIQPGVDVLGIRGGAHQWASVSHVEHDHESAVARQLATVAGIAVVDDDVRVEGAGGATRARELSEGDRLELVHPSDLAPFDRPPSPLRGLGSLTAVLPTENGCGDAIEGKLDELLLRAGLRGEKVVGGRWMAIQVGRVRSVGWSWADEAELVSALHAWEAEGDGPSELRLRSRDHVRRKLVLGALIASHRGFVARAAPAFSPVELRVAESENLWPAYSPISSCAECRADTLVMSVAADRWSVIADLLILRPRRTE
jgi:hypothetical protein